MKAEDILLALGEIDEMLPPDCTQPAKKKPSPWKTVVAIAACFAAVLISVIAVRNHTSLPPSAQTTAQEASATVPAVDTESGIYTFAAASDAVSAGDSEAPASSAASAAQTASQQSAASSDAAVTTTASTTRAAATTASSTTQSIGFTYSNQRSTTQQAQTTSPATTSAPTQTAVTMPLTQATTTTTSSAATSYTPVTTAATSDLWQENVANVLSGSCYTVSDGRYTVSYNNGTIVAKDGESILYEDDPASQSRLLSELKSKILGLKSGYTLESASGSQETYTNGSRTLVIFYSSGGMDHMAIDGTYYAYSVKPYA